MDTWQELQSHIDKVLGLRSEVVDEYLGSVNLNYISPTGLVLFSLWLTKTDSQWVWVGVSGLLSNPATISKLPKLQVPDPPRD